MTFCIQDSEVYFDRKKTDGTGYRYEKNYEIIECVNSRVAVNICAQVTIFVSTFKQLTNNVYFDYKNSSFLQTLNFKIFVTNCCCCCCYLRCKTLNASALTLRTKDTVSDITTNQY